MDVTNGSYCECNLENEERSEGCEYCDRGRIDNYVDLEEDQPTKRHTCKECGTVIIDKHQTYKVPENSGHLVNV